MVLDLNQAIFWGEFIKTAHSMFSPGLTNPSLPASFPASWKLVQNITLEAVVEFIHQQEFIGFVVQSLEDPNHIAFVFHGTEDILELIDDFEFSMIPFSIIPNGGNTEFGFTRLYESLSFIDPDSERSQSLAEFLNGLDPAVSVTVAGHSLGGALACLHSAVIASRCISLELYTYAAPMVGDQTFVDTFHSLVSESWRISNKPDLVPNLPGEFLGYAQTHTLFEINSLNYSISRSLVGFHSIDTYLYVLKALNESPST